jgi:hypothetical protein
MSESRQPSDVPGTVFYLIECAICSRLDCCDVAGEAERGSPSSVPSASDMQILMRQLDPGTKEDASRVPGKSSPNLWSSAGVVGFLEAYWITIETALSFSYYPWIPPVPRMPNEYYINKYPQPGEICRRIDSGIEKSGADAVARGIIVDIVSMCSHGACGALIVGRLFARCSLRVRVFMLQHMAPFFASIACDEHGGLAAHR